MQNKYETLSDLVKKSGKKIFIVVENVRSAYNVGAMFRTADGAGNVAMVLVGYTPTPENPKVKKTALGAEELIPWCQVATTAELINFCKDTKTSLVAVELTPEAKNLFAWQSLEDQIFLAVGNEVTGVSLELIMAATDSVMLPMNGQKASLNVAEATSILIYEMLRKSTNL